ncbi:hypothetical protein ACLM5J_04200 [Nocardioides sp. Bht2]|uniref:hypothetical protein n=1 Tax=Nocardioides sp. Bht2 TaxID=3392297 RepID=UPI0039B6D347
MSQHPPEHDPFRRSLGDLVTSGNLTPAQADAAWRAGVAQPAILHRGETVTVALGTTLLAAAVTFALWWSRPDADLDWAVYGPGLGAALGLVLVALAAWKVVGDPERRANLIAWPGAVGAISIGLMIGVGMDDTTGTTYVVGAVILALSVLGHLITPRPPFLFSALLGLLVLYLQGVEDLFSDALDLDEIGDNAGMVPAVATVLFVVVITILGRRYLPGGELLGVVVGLVGMVSLTVTAIGLGVAAFFFEMIGAFSADFSDGEMPSEGSDLSADAFHNDLWVVLLCGALLIAFWLWLAWRDGPVGYRVLALATGAVLVPVVSVALDTEHPAVWIAVVLAAGAATFVAVLSRAVIRSR